MDFLSTIAKATAYDKGLAEQSAKDAEAMASQYAHAGFQEGLKQAPMLYAASDVRENAVSNRFANGADYRALPAPQVTNQGWGGKAYQVEKPVVDGNTSASAFLKELYTKGK